MKNEHDKLKKHGLISYFALIIGVICFFIVFITPTRIANIGNLAGDYITFFLTAAGIILSIIGLGKKTEKISFRLYLLYFPLLSLYFG